MAKVLVTGSADPAGIGAAIVAILHEQGHQPIAHARDAARRQVALSHLPPGTPVVVGDLSVLGGMRAVAADAVRLGVEVFVSNAGFATKATERRQTPDGVEEVFAVNALAPHVLAGLLGRLSRIVVVSSNAFKDWTCDPRDLELHERWTPANAYANSKLVVSALTLAWARRQPNVLINAVHPGWVHSKMAPPEAPLSAREGADTAAWLAVSDDPAALTTGRFWIDRQPAEINPQMFEVDFQDTVYAYCQELGERA